MTSSSILFKNLIVPAIVIFVILFLLRNTFHPISAQLEILWSGESTKSDSNLYLLVDAAISIVLPLAYWKIDFFKEGVNSLGKTLEAQDHVFTTQDCVVTYRLGDTLLPAIQRRQTEQQLTDILNANPDADLTKMENALHVKIIDVQRRIKSEKLAPPRPPLI